MTVELPELPPDTRVAGGPDPADDVNRIIRFLRALRDRTAVYADRTDPDGVDFAGPLTVNGVPVGTGVGGEGNIEPGTQAGQVPVWDGDGYVPVTPMAVQADDIPVTSTPDLPYTDVQSALAGLATDVTQLEDNPITAADVPFTPTGTISSTSVQAALAEVAAESSGQVLTLFARKTANEAVTASTAVQDDDHLFLTVEPNAVYLIDAFLIYLAGNNNPDLLLAWSGPAGATFDWTAGGLLSTVTTVTGSIHLQHRAIGETVAVGATTSAAVARPSGLLVTGVNGGTFRFRWAQNTSDASATEVRANSWLRAQRVA
jgi:hypothetical protein